MTQKLYRKAGMLYIVRWLSLAILFVGLPCGVAIGLSKVLSIPESTLPAVAIVGVILLLFVGHPLLAKQKIRCPQCGQVQMHFGELGDADRTQIVTCSNCGFEAKTGIQKDAGT